MAGIARVTHRLSLLDHKGSRRNGIDRELSDASDGTVIVGHMKVMTLLASSYGSLERQVEEALRGVAPERIVSISYSTSRLFTIWLQHSVLIVLHDA